MERSLKMSKRIKAGSKRAGNGWGDTVRFYAHRSGEIGFEVVEDVYQTEITLSPEDLTDALPILEEIVARIKEAKDGK
jgi:hypothetical protein